MDCRRATSPGGRDMRAEESEGARALNRERCKTKFSLSIRMIKIMD